MNRPIVAITMGDPAGVGPEVCAKALYHPYVYDFARPLVVGDIDRMHAATPGCRLSYNAIEDPADGIYTHGTIDVVDLANVPEDLPWGEVSAVAGDAAYQYVERAAKFAVEGSVDAICTAPLNKEALQLGGHDYPGHTEMLAHLTGTAEVSMMLTAPRLRVIHVTTHLGLLDAIAAIEPGLVERTIRRGHELLVRAGIEHPRIAVCGINPHAGENGLFGSREEETKVNPGVAAARADGIDATDALPADSVFFRARRGDFDLVVAMYHDQGHTPIKALGMEHGVNVTVGLPIVRTSVDHGTAFDIAGTGRGNEQSMLEALRQAVDLAGR